MASTVTRLSFIAAVAAALSTGCWGPSPESGPAAEIYGNCISCHMENGGGKQIILAPAIAGLPQWYVEDSVRKFRSGVRGSHFYDVAGMRMRPMARTLKEAQITPVAEYVANLPPVPQPKTMEGGDATKGKALFATCTACHGADGSGTTLGKPGPTSGPPIARMADWYIYEQLSKFRTGMRGADGKRDPNGFSMANMAKTTLKNEQAVKDVIAYIGTLGK
jgi:cytochrome c553